MTTTIDYMPQTSKPNADFPCPVSGCLTFAFGAQEEVDEHVASGAHLMSLSTHVPREIGFETERAGFGSATRGAGSPQAPASEEDLEAINYARTYSGSFQFMVDMREKAQTASWRPTPNMTSAILRCKAKDVRPAAAQDGAPQAPANLRPNKFAGSCRSCGGSVPAGQGGIEKVAGAWTVFHAEGGCAAAAAAAVSSEAPQAPSAPLPDVPQGFYAVETEAGHLAFYEVDRPTEGKWAGRTFLSVLASDERHPIRGAAARSILEKIAEDAPGAMARFGQEIGRCGRCRRTLTDETSRSLGIGPECRKHVGLAPYPPLTGRDKLRLGREA